MKKLYIVAALLMATTSAHAGGISFQINGERVRIEAPRNCGAISCVKVISPGYTGTIGNVDLKGMGKKKGDDDVVTTAPAAPPAPAPAQATAPQPPLPLRQRRHPPCSNHRRDGTRTGPKLRRPLRLRRPRRSRRACAAPAPGPRSRVRPELAGRHLGDGREQGQRAHRGMRRQSVRLFRQHRRKNPDQHEAAGSQVDRPDPRSRQRPQLRLDDCAEEHRFAQGPGLRLRRHVLRRPDLEARELTSSPRDLRPCGSPQGLLYASLETP